MILPKRHKRAKMGVREPNRIECPAHLKWVRGHECLCAGHGRFGFECKGRIEAHHQRTRGAGGGDDQAVPLCAFHHALLDSPGWSQKRMEEEWKVDFEQTAAQLWLVSEHGKRWRREREKAA